MITAFLLGALVFAVGVALGKNMTRDAYDHILKNNIGEQ